MIVIPPAWRNFFRGFFGKEVVLFDQGVPLTVVSDFPSTEDLTSVVSMVNYPASITSIVEVLLCLVAMLMAP